MKILHEANVSIRILSCRNGANTTYYLPKKLFVYENSQKVCCQNLRQTWCRWIWYIVLFGGIIGEYTMRRHLKMLLKGLSAREYRFDICSFFQYRQINVNFFLYKICNYWQRWLFTVRNTAWQCCVHFGIKGGI